MERHLLARLSAETIEVGRQSGRRKERVVVCRSWGGERAEAARSPSQPSDQTTDAPPPVTTGQMVAGDSVRGGTCHAGLGGWKDHGRAHRKADDATRRNEQQRGERRRGVACVLVVMISGTARVRKGGESRLRRKKVKETNHGEKPTGRGIDPGALNRHAETPRARGSTACLVTSRKLNEFWIEAYRCHRANLVKLQGESEPCPSL